MRVISPNETLLATAGIRPVSRGSPCHLATCGTWRSDHHLSLRMPSIHQWNLILSCPRCVLSPSAPLISPWRDKALTQLNSRSASDSEWYSQATSARVACDVASVRSRYVGFLFRKTTCQVNEYMEQVCEVHYLDPQYVALLTVHPLDSVTKRSPRVGVVTCTGSHARDTLISSTSDTRYLIPSLRQPPQA